MFKTGSPFVEGLKQLLRVALVAVIPLVISGLSSNSLDVKSIAVAGMIAVLMGIDKWLHQSNEGVKVLGGDGLIGF